MSAHIQSTTHMYISITNTDAYTYAITYLQTEVSVKNLRANFGFDESWLFCFSKYMERNFS